MNHYNVYWIFLTVLFIFFLVKFVSYSKYVYHVHFNENCCFLGKKTFCINLFVLVCFFYSIFVDFHHFYLCCRPITFRDCYKVMTCLVSRYFFDVLTHQYMNLLCSSLIMIHCIYNIWKPGLTLTGLIWYFYICSRLNHLCKKYYCKTDRFWKFILVSMSLEKSL